MMLRAMTQTDIDAVLSIEQVIQAYPWTRGNFSDALEQGYFCYVEQQGEDIRGYAVLMPLPDEAELLTIGVATAHQRKGLGRTILQAMLEMAKAAQLQQVFLEVRPANAAAIALYQHSGFGQVGLRKDYYKSASGNDDALVMACALTQGRGRR